MKPACGVLAVALLMAPGCGNGNDNGSGGGPPPSPTNPQVTSISPNRGVTSGGTDVTVTGSRFVTGATLTLGGTAAATVRVDSATSIAATTSSRGAGEVDVVVTNPNGESGTLARGFTYFAPTLTANPGGPYLVNDVRTLITFSAIQSTSDPFPIARYLWDCGQPIVQNCVRETTVPTAEFRYRKSSAGADDDVQVTYTVRLAIVDTAGNRSAEATTQVTVTNGY